MVKPAGWHVFNLWHPFVLPPSQDISPSPQIAGTGVWQTGGQTEPDDKQKLWLPIDQLWIKVVSIFSKQNLQACSGSQESSHGCCHCRTKLPLLHKLLELGYGRHVGRLSLPACRYCHGYILQRIGKHTQTLDFLLFVSQTCCRTSITIHFTSCTFYRNWSMARRRTSWS